MIKYKNLIGAGNELVNKYFITTYISNYLIMVRKQIRN
jgi:hypothetical protein